MPRAHSDSGSFVNSLKYGGRRRLFIIRPARLRHTCAVAFAVKLDGEWRTLFVEACWYIGVIWLKVGFVPILNNKNGIRISMILRLYRMEISRD